MTAFPQGSEWRKWDLHVHPPGTKLSDGYNPLDWDRFCAAVENSDVAAFGITDYFSFDGYRTFTSEYYARHADSGKVFFPNLELRLNEAVNGASDPVDIHLIFRPDIDVSRMTGFLADLVTEITDGRNRALKCSELTEGSQFESATVTRENLRKALQSTFGPNWGPDDVIIIVPASNNGIRAASGKQRKANLADQIDKFAHGIFGSSRNVEWFLRTDRYEDITQGSVPKPVFAGSDSHSYEQLDQWLGKLVSQRGAEKEITWVKADPTYEGLLQTFIEPSERVRIQPLKPDDKDAYKYIASVTFSGREVFPAGPIPLNRNLVSVIGSRSSGKSAFLAYMAHAVDPDYTTAQQEASGIAEAGKAGPAAGLTWADVADIKCEVEWGDPAATSGRVVYIPQNSLYSVSERPEEITGKIQPALYRIDPSFATAHNRALNEVANANDAIRRCVEHWFQLQDQVGATTRELQDLGDPKAITSTRNTLAQRVKELRDASALTEEEVGRYQEVVDSLSHVAARNIAIHQEIAALAPLVQVNPEGGYVSTEDVVIDIRLLPTSSVLPEKLATSVRARIDTVGSDLQAQLRRDIAEYRVGLEVEQRQNRVRSDEVNETNRELIEKNRANTELEAMVVKEKRQGDLLDAVHAKQELIQVARRGQAAEVEQIKGQLLRRTQALDDLTEYFNASPRSLDGMSFGIERKVSDDAITAVSSTFNRQENTRYFDRSRGEHIALDLVITDPASFLTSLASGTQKVRVGESARKLAANVLVISPEVRFYATLEGDRIGGFERSSMTPGKQALFALTLIINESTEAWPLLLDQPEDDLDSRSIFLTIVPYLMSRKSDRQILMVSHDANMVIGADSEQVIVANRHGEDRKNRESRMFSYLTGSLESSCAKRQAEYVLETCGIREHACEILDGGEEAFRKRRDKYHM